MSNYIYTISILYEYQCVYDWASFDLTTHFVKYYIIFQEVPSSSAPDRKMPTPQTVDSNEDDLRLLPRKAIDTFAFCLATTVTAAFAFLLASDAFPHIYPFRPLFLNVFIFLTTTAYLAIPIGRY